MPRPEPNKKLQRFVGADKFVLVNQVRLLEAKIEQMRTALENAEQHLDLYVNGMSSIEDGQHTLVHVREALKQ